MPFKRHAIRIDLLPIQNPASMMADAAALCSLLCIFELEPAFRQGLTQARPPTRLYCVA
jgi:hypothetical protein